MYLYIFNFKGAYLGGFLAVIEEDDEKAFARAKETVDVMYDPETVKLQSKNSIETPGALIIWDGDY